MIRTSKCCGMCRIPILSPVVPETKSKMQTFLNCCHLTNLDSLYIAKSNKIKGQLSGDDDVAFFVPEWLPNETVFFRGALAGAAEASLN